MKIKQFTRFYALTIGKKDTLTLAGISCLFAPLQIATIILPFFIEKFVDEIQNGVFSFTYPKLLFFLYAAVFALQMLLTYMYGKKYAVIKNKMQLTIINKILHLNPRYVKTMGEGFFSSLMEQSLESLINLLTPINVGKCITLIQNVIILAVLYYKSVFVGIICTGLFLLYMIAYIINNKLFSTLLNGFIKKSGESTALMFDFIQGNETLLASKNAVPFASAKIKTILDTTRQIEFKLQYFFDMLFTAIGSFIQPCVNVLIIIILGENVIHGTATFGAFIFVLTYYNILQSGLHAFQTISDIFFRATGALKSVYEFFDFEKTHQAQKISARERNYFYRFENVSLRLQDTVILDDATITLPVSECCCFAGLSGQGKSSIVNMLTGLQQPDSGKLFFLNADNNVNAVSPLEQIALFSQHAEIFNLTLQDNIFLGDVFDEAEYNGYIRMLELEKLHDRLLGSGGRHISGGERQRVSLARFLHQLKQKEYFIIDEGFVSLDAITKEKMLSVTVQAVQGKTGLVITHDDDVFQKFGGKVLVCTQVHTLSLLEKQHGKPLKEYLQ